MIIHQEFEKNQHILNIELGAGCGDFGKRFYPECFLTDKNILSVLKKSCPGSCHVTVSCDAIDVPCNENRFERVIICNPYGYGFHDKEEASLLLAELYRITQDKGKIIILANKINKFAAPQRVRKNVSIFNNSKQSFELIIEESIDIKKEYKDYKFFHGNYVREARPNCRITLICQK